MSRWFASAVCCLLVTGCAAVDSGVPVPGEDLTVRGIVGWTNVERNQNGGLAPLEGDAGLDAVAEARALDMVERQYFAHVSDEGNSAESVAQEKGYGYVVIGENIALGNFRDDEDLVSQWMGSPSHRANILKTTYTHMGAAAVRAQFEGSEQWIAVQIFATPLSACPGTDLETAARIAEDKKTIAGMEEEAERKSDEVRNLPPSAERDERIAEYNDLVRRIRDLQGETNGLIDAYNASVERRNACLRSYQS